MTYESLVRVVPETPDFLPLTGASALSGLPEATIEACARLTGIPAWDAYDPPLIASRAVGGQRRYSLADCRFMAEAEADCREEIEGWRT